MFGNPNAAQSNEYKLPDSNPYLSSDIPEHERRSGVWSLESHRQLQEKNSPQATQAVLTQMNTSNYASADQEITQPRYSGNWTQVTTPAIRQASAQGADVPPRASSLPMPPIVSPGERRSDLSFHSGLVAEGDLSENDPATVPQVLPSQQETHDLRLIPTTYDDMPLRGNTPPTMLTRLESPSSRPAFHEMSGDVATESFDENAIEDETTGAKYSDAPMPKFYGKGEQKEEAVEKDGRKGFGFLPKSTSPVLTVLSSVAIVLGVFFILVWLMKRAAPRQAGVLPQEVFEKLGSVQFSPKMQMHLFRLGGKLVLVSLTPDGMEPVAEVTDPDEVVHLIGLCKQNDPKSSSAAFRKVLKQYTGENGPQQQKQMTGNFAPQQQYPQQPMQQHPPQNMQQMVRRPVGIVSPGKAYQR